MVLQAAAAGVEETDSPLRVPRQGKEDPAAGSAAPSKDGAEEAEHGGETGNEVAEEEGGETRQKDERERAGKMPAGREKAKQRALPRREDRQSHQCQPEGEKAVERGGGGGGGGRRK